MGGMGGMQQGGMQQGGMMGGQQPMGGGGMGMQQGGMMMGGQQPMGGGMGMQQQHQPQQQQQPAQGGNAGTTAGSSNPFDMFDSPQAATAAKAASPDPFGDLAFGN